MGDSLKKTGHYRRATQSIGQVMTLQSALDLCRDGYPPPLQYPTFRCANGLDAIVAQHSTDDDRRDYLHLVLYEHGAGAAVIETLRRQGVGEEPAPQAKQYIQSQIYVLCRDGDVVFTTHNAPTRDSTISVIINRLIATFSGCDAQYMLTATLDQERFRAMMQDGIQEIDLDVGGYRSTLEYLSNAGRIEGAGLISILKSFVTDDATPEELDAAEKVMGRLTLRPGRNWDDAHVHDLLTGMADSIIDDDDGDAGFAIVTKSGLRITRDSVRVQDSFRVDGNRRIVDTVQVKAGLTAAFDRFDELGVLEQ